MVGCIVGIEADGGHVMHRAQVDAAEERVRQLEQHVKRALATCRAERTRYDVIKKELDEEKQVPHILLWLRFRFEKTECKSLP